MVHSVHEIAPLHRYDSLAKTICNETQLEDVRDMPYTVIASDLRSHGLEGFLSIRDDLQQAMNSLGVQHESISVIQSTATGAAAGAAISFLATKGKSEGKGAVAGALVGAGVSLARKGQIRREMLTQGLGSCMGLLKGLHKLTTALFDQTILFCLTASAFASHQGKWIFDNKVAKTLQRSAKLATRLMESMRELTLDTPHGKVAGYSLPIPTEQFHRFTVRICKGLLTEFYPHFDYSKTTFLTESVLPTVESNKMLAEMLSQLKCVSRGNTVFRFWHGHVIDHPDKGLFVLMFYEGAVALAFYGTDLKLPLVP